MCETMDSDGPPSINLVPAYFSLQPSHLKFDYSPLVREWGRLSTSDEKRFDTFCGQYRYTKLRIDVRLRPSSHHRLPELFLLMAEQVRSNANRVCEAVPGLRDSACDYFHMYSSPHPPPSKFDSFFPLSHLFSIPFQSAPNQTYFVIIAYLIRCLWDPSQDEFISARIAYGGQPSLYLLDPSSSSIYPPAFHPFAPTYSENLALFSGIWEPTNTWHMINALSSRPRIFSVLISFCAYPLLEGGIVIDAGANVGQYTLIAALMNFTVYSFEPIEEHVLILSYSFSSSVHFPSWRIWWVVSFSSQFG